MGCVTVRSSDLGITDVCERLMRWHISVPGQWNIKAIRAKCRIIRARATGFLFDLTITWMVF